MPVELSSKTELFLPLVPEVFTLSAVERCWGIEKTRVYVAGDVAVLTPSDAVNVKVKVPAYPSVVVGVIVNLFIFAPVPCTTVAVAPPPLVREPPVTLYVYVNGAPSGSVAVIVTTVAVPSVAKFKLVAPLEIVGAAFTSAILYQPAPFQT